MIYAYPSKSRNEGNIFIYLSKLQGKLMVDASSDEFISNVLPLIKNDIAKFYINWYGKIDIARFLCGDIAKFLCGDIAQFLCGCLFNQLVLI